MLRLSKRSVSTFLRSAGDRSFRVAAAATSISRSAPSSTTDSRRGESESRWYSSLTNGKCMKNDSLPHLNMKTNWFMGYRNESSAAASDSASQAPPPVEKYEYQAEVSRLMDLIVNSLYSNKEVFLRELISNASDALDKLRYLSVTNPELSKDVADLDIRIYADKENGVITLTDSGIGMTRQELVDCLGTIAQSGTAKFLKALKDNKDAGGDNNLIGQFGVGFYSAFLVADRVTVSTKSPKSDKQYVWESEADSSSYTIKEETDPQLIIPRGTRITLHLKRDEKGYADPERIQKLVKNYSQFVSFPIYTWQEKGYTKEVEVDDDPAESKKDDQDDQTELRNSKEVTTEEYNEFYRKTFNEYLDPLASSHFTTEGEVEFRSILYVPPVSPMGKDDVVNQKTKNIRLYVKRVFISDDFDGELFPRYLSFIKGVVDSHDLPLNVSREILQESRIVRIMKKRLVKKAFDMILGISLSENREDYEKFWDNFGKHLKLGCIEDRENHKRLAPLLRFFSSQSENDMISLDEYVENMKAEQKAIYYIASDSVTRDKNEEKEAAVKKEFGQTCDWIKKRLGDKVASVQISSRLSSSPCVLVSGKFGWSANMERLMKAQAGGDTTSLEFMKGRRVFEINPDHSIIKNINAAYKSNPNDEDAMRAIDLMYDAALVSSGFTPENPAELGGKIYEMMGIALSGKWSSPEVQPQQQHMAHSHNAELLEAEVVEPVEVDGKK
uniref:Uncharacterized protein n=1 Tax=Brassica campestris TaxID=3711 RepID=M4ELK9_BRACM